MLNTPSSSNTSRSISHTVSRVNSDCGAASLRAVAAPLASPEARLIGCLLGPMDTTVALLHPARHCAAWVGSRGARRRPALSALPGPSHSSHGGPLLGCSHQGL